uniref:rRNA methyltransferase 1, mitochondrial n=1 Tax=Doryrhamphus excisus TaxID=161450 RepID=UPI0025ADC2CA|nr:rRNA methyltransferase 1, mitochondrial [Doryrhamphus excisus]
MRSWGLCKFQPLDSQCVFYNVNSNNSRLESSSSQHHRSQGGMRHNERHRYRLSSELQKLSLEDSSSERGKPARQMSPPDSADDLDIVFGIAPCLLALTQGRRKALKLFVKDGQTSQRASVVKICEEAHRRGVPVQRVSKRELTKMSSGGVHQGVCLQATPLSFLTADSTPSLKSKPLWLVLDGIQDPMNLGAILRSAYFLGVDRVVSSLRHSCPLTPVVSKASAGVMEVMGVYGYEDLEDMVTEKVAQGWRVVGTVAAGAPATHVPVTPCSHFLMSKPTLLLIGGEGEGLSQKMLFLCQTLVSIPAGRELLPGVESLNVSVATGILLHSLLTATRTP